MSTPKFFVFAYDLHEACGGVDDLIATCDSFEEAESAVRTIKGGPYGYFETAHISSIDRDGQLIKLSEYSNLDNKGWTKDDATA